MTIIVVTADVKAVTRERALVLGANEDIVKPIVSGDFTRRLMRLIG